VHQNGDLLKIQPLKRIFNFLIGLKAGYSGGTLPQYDANQGRQAKRITVGVDARPLGDPMSGIPRYLSELLFELAKDDRFRFILMSNRPIHVGQLDAANIEICEDPGWSKGTVWLVARLGSLLRQHDVDVFWGTQHILPCFRQPGIKYLLTVHDVVHRIMPSSMTLRNLIISRLFLARSVGIADAIITVSQATRQDLLRFYPKFPPDRITTVYSGRSLSSEVGKPPSTSEPYLFCLGSIEPRKNLLFLLQTYHILAARHPDLKLVLGGGGGWKSGPVRDYVRQNHLDEKVIFTGFLSDSDIVSLLENARLFVFPSLYEGFGLPLLEAVGRCPAVVSDIDVFRELGGHLKNIEFCDFRQDPDQAAQCLERLLSRPDLPLLDFESEQSKNLFTWKQAASATADLLLQLADQRKQ
jgi:glycosyltransferase involved in cell wall biosynthesis